MCVFLATLISAVGMNAKPKIIDLTKKLGLAETLTEARVNCSLEEKVCCLIDSSKSNYFFSSIVFRICICITF